MKKINYRPVYNRKKQLNKQGKALLQIEAYLDRKKVYFSTHIYLSPKQWDDRKKQIIHHPNAEALNVMMRSFMIELEQRELEIWKSGQEISLVRLKSEVNPQNKDSFIEFARKEISGSQLKESTRRNRMTTCQLLQRFKADAEFRDITSRFIFEFENFLYANGCQMNTVAKHMKHLKLFVNSSINKGHLRQDEYPFIRYRIRTKEGKHVFLLPGELKKLEELSIKPLSPHLQHTLDVFLFCCYTGIRYSDFCNLSESCIHQIEEKPWLVFHSVKTGYEVKLPLSLLFEGKAWSMLQKYNNRLEQFFQAGTNSCLNKRLIRIGKMAGIDKHFSFHSARHTNATLLIYKGAKITTVQKLLGHRDLATTQIYSEIMECTIEKDLKECYEKQKCSKG